MNLASIIEALIFASPEALEISKIKEVLELSGLEVTNEQIDNEILGLKEKWQGSETGMQLATVGGGLVFRTNPEFGPFVSVLLKNKPQKLSASSLEILAIIAYKQPITRLDMEEIRGVDCAAPLRKLLGLKLVKVLGKQEGVGRPLLYGTSKQFLEFFGLNSLHDLPSLRDFHELQSGASPKEAVDGAEEGIDPSLVDLFATHENTPMFSEATEKMSAEALKRLDQALNLVTGASNNVI